MDKALYRLILHFSLGMICLTSVVGCHGPRPIEGAMLTEAEVRDFISQYDRAWEDRDTTLMRSLMHDRYTYFTSNGSTTTREKIIGWFNPADKYRADTAYRREIAITINSNTAIVSSRWTGNGVFDTGTFNDDQRCSLVIQKENGKLVLLAEHCTQITP